MPSILTTPPATEPVTLAEAKAYLRVAHADEDALISTLIVAARRHAEARTGLVFISQGWSQFRDGWPDLGVIELAPAPVIAVSSLKVYDGAGVAVTIDPASYYVDRLSRPARVMLLGSAAWPEPGRIGNGIELVLTAGFGAAADVPGELREAMLQMVAHWFGNRGDDGSGGIPLDVGHLLNMFRGVRL